MQFQKGPKRKSSRPPAPDRAISDDDPHAGFTGGAGRGDRSKKTGRVGRERRHITRNSHLHGIGLRLPGREEARSTVGLPPIEKAGPTSVAAAQAIVAAVAARRSSRRPRPARPLAKVVD